MDSISIKIPVALLKAGDYHPAEFHPVDMMVEVLIPLDEKNVANAFTIQELKKENSISVLPNPILTIAGLRCCYNQLRSAFLPEEVEKDGSLNDDGWE